MNNAPLPNHPIAFQTENQEVVAKKGVKLRNRDAEAKEIEERERENYRAKFDALVDKTAQFNHEKQKRAVSAVSRFMNLASDKTLVSNKGVVALDVEKEIRQDLIEIGIDLNNDPTEDRDGMGGITLISVLCKIILQQRDRLNQIEYDLSTIKRNLGSSNAGNGSNNGSLYDLSTARRPTT